MESHHGRRLLRSSRCLLRRVSRSSLRSLPKFTHPVLARSKHNFRLSLSGSQLPVFSTQPTETASFCGDSRSVRKERRKWPPSDDLVLISAWLNTSKDAVVSNEQKASTFWAALPITLKLVRRWQEVISQNLFSKTSGQSESDVVKLAHEIFFNDH
uniref:Uncharacterized protein n=1 Tax=Brassica oleracea TaxID=3712 RepID=A0A3P6G4L2_BRAOL|nr:unnamed protein product [Brassica oleracea]